MGAPCPVCARRRAGRAPANVSLQLCLQIPLGIGVVAPKLLPCLRWDSHPPDPPLCTPRSASSRVTAPAPESSQPASSTSCKTDWVAVAPFIPAPLAGTRGSPPPAGEGSGTAPAGGAGRAGPRGTRAWDPGVGPSSPAGHCPPRGLGAPPLEKTIRGRQLQGAEGLAPARWGGQRTDVLTALVG